MEFFFTDVSIWLHQAVKGYRDKDGTPLPNAHLLGIFHRICKLLHYGIKPVFVFDGGVPSLKKQTLNSRKQRKIEASDKSQVAKTKLLRNFLERHLQKETKKALPPSLRMSSKISAGFPSPKKSPQKSINLEEVDEFAEYRQKILKNIEQKCERVTPDNGSPQDEEENWSEEDENDFDVMRDYSEHFSTITSSNFDSLSLESQHEILFQMQESKKMNSWGKMHEMPREPMEFSSFQVDRLLKRRYLQKKIQSVQKEMGQRHIHIQNLDELAAYEAEFGTDIAATEVIGSKEKGILFLKPKSSPIAGSSRSAEIENNQSAQSIDKQMKVISFEDYVIETSSSSENEETMGNKTRETEIQNLPPIIEIEDDDIALAIKLSLKQQENDKASKSKNSQVSNSSIYGDKMENVLLDEAEESEMQEAIQLSLLEDKRNSTYEKSDGNVTCSPKQLGRYSLQKYSTSNGASPTKSNNKSGTSISPPHVISVADFQQTVGEDFSSPCYKFLGWVGFSDKVPPTSASPTKNLVPSSKKLNLRIESSSKVMDDIVELISSSSESEDDFEDVDLSGEERIEDEKSLVEHLMANSKSPLLIGSAGNDISTNQDGSMIKIVIPSDVVLTEKDDFFADVFQSEDKIENNSKAFELATSTEKALELSNDNEGIERAENFQNEAHSSIVSREIQNIEDVEVEQDTEVIEVRTLSDEEPTEDDEVDWGSDPDLSSEIEITPTNESTQADSQITRTLGIIPSQATPSSSSVHSTHMISMKYMQAQEKLNYERGKLQAEMGNQDRMSASITDQMYAEAQELLTLFGIPFVVSKMEAESQCAFFDSACLTEGTITDDSDIWLFGGLRVYKNFFSHGEKHVELFQYADIVRRLHLDREKLVLMAMLTGSDYTHGIEGVGPVTALEILTEFPTDNISAFDSLILFHKWWESQAQKNLILSENKIRDKFRKLKIRPGFPSKVVYEAYMNPSVDPSIEPFRWGSPELDTLRHYTKHKFGWDQSRTDAILAPVLKELFFCQDKEIKRQTTLDNFVSIVHKEGSGSSKRVIKSKRLLRAMKKLKDVGLKNTPNEVDLSNSSSEDSESESPQSKKKDDLPLPTTTRKRLKQNNPKIQQCKRSKASASASGLASGSGSTSASTSASAAANQDPLNLKPKSSLYSSETPPLIGSTNQDINKPTLQLLENETSKEKTRVESDTSRSWGTNQKRLKSRIPQMIQQDEERKMNKMKAIQVMKKRKKSSTDST